MNDYYAIPTKLTPYESMTLDWITAYVRSFIEDACHAGQDQFMASRIGCSDAGPTRRGLDLLNIELARALSIGVTVLTPDYDRYGQAAPFVLDRWMCWADTDLVTLGAPQDRLSRHLIEVCREAGLPAHVVEVERWCPAALAGGGAVDLFGWSSKKGSQETPFKRPKA
jgi:hypothetical protein